MMAVLAGLGCHVLIRRMPRALKLLPLGIPMAMLLAGWHANDRSRYRIAESFGMSVFRSLPPGAHLIATDDNILFSLLYLHLVERLRPDVNLIPQGVGDADLPPLRFNPDNEPVFFTHHPNWSLPSLELVPVGLLFRACRAGEPPPEPILPEPLEGERDPRVPKDYLTQNLIGQFHYMLGFTFEQRDWPRARREFEEAAAAAPHNDVLFYNLGLIFRRNGLVDDALRAFERSHAINPRYLASHTRARASDRVRELVAERERLLRLERRLVEPPAIRDIEPGTPAYHRSMAELLEEQGETLAARGHRLRALEQASPINNDPR
jgi:tetratricopeptide (TPR) repeat protein